jgi:hypothetical protein
MIEIDGLLPCEQKLKKILLLKNIVTKN